MPVTNSRAVNLAVEVQKVWDEADAEERSLTPVERDRVETLIERAREAKALEEKLGELEGGVTWQHGDAVAAKGPGDQFIQSKGYKQLVERGFGSGQFSTGQVELQTKGTLVSTPGSALTPAGYVPGVVENLFQRPYLADLFPNREAPGNPVRYVAETTVTNAAAAVAETGLKPESTLGFSEVSEPVKKIATWLPISDEMLEDAPQIQQYLNSRLALFVKLQEEAQILSGSGPACSAWSTATRSRSPSAARSRMCATSASTLTQVKAVDRSAIRYLDGLLTKKHEARYRTLATTLELPTSKGSDSVSTTDGSRLERPARSPPPAPALAQDISQLLRHRRRGHRRRGRVRRCWRLRRCRWVRWLQWRWRVRRVRRRWRVRWLQRCRWVRRLQRCWRLWRLQRRRRWRRWRCW